MGLFPKIKVYGILEQLRKKSYIYVEMFEIGHLYVQLM